jgi:hypothetical protein
VTYERQYEGPLMRGMYTDENGEYLDLGDYNADMSIKYGCTPITR